jgi:hypothetical protein
LIERKRELSFTYICNLTNVRKKSEKEKKRKKERERE